MNEALARRITAGEYKPLMIDALSRLSVEEHEEISGMHLMSAMRHIPEHCRSEYWIKFHSYLGDGGKWQLVISAVC